jgi:hypothetical protein
MLSMRSYFRFVVASTMVGLAACSDTGRSPSGPDVPALSAHSRPSLDDISGGNSWGTQTSTFTLTAAGGTFDIGGFYTLTVPADGVCTLSSSYGPGTWDSPCDTLGPNESITVTATFGFSHGGPGIDFSPALRFSPSVQVTLSTALYANLLTNARGFINANPAAFRRFGMYYAPSYGSDIVTDAATDPSLVTHINLTTGLVWRRVKHFSGYNVTSGLECTPSPDDPDCIEVPPIVEQ